MKCPKRGWLPLFIGLFLLVPAAFAASFDEGIEYQRVEPAQPTSSGDRIEVVEMFWYGCPHCYHLEPYVKEWLADKPEDVAFVRVPAVFNERWALHARAFYAAELLGIGDRMHGAIFHAMHEQDRRLPSGKALEDLFAENGVERDAFRKAFDSFMVHSKVRRAATLTKRYGISGVPSLIVQGRYRTSASLAGSNERMFEIVDFLVDEERKDGE